MLNVQWLTWDKTTLQMDGVEQFTWAGAWEENWERRIQGFEKQPESQKKTMVENIGNCDFTIQLVMCMYTYMYMYTYVHVVYIYRYIPSHKI